MNLEQAMSEVEGLKQRTLDLMEQLAAQNVFRVRVAYSGEGDDGDVSEVTFYGPPTDPSKPDNLPIIESQSTELDVLEGKIHYLAYDYIDEHHSGCFNNDGASGTITLNIITKQVVIDHDDYYKESTNSYNEIELA